MLQTPKLSLLFVTVVLAARAPKLTAALHKVPWDLFALWGHLFLSFFLLLEVLLLHKPMSPPPLCQSQASSQPASALECLHL